jgi:small subunit ribosomal protein S6
MKHESENLYEGMYVIAANISEDAKRVAADKIKAMIVERGGNIVKEHDMGRRRLAYELRGQREGNYLLLYFNLKPSIMKELWKEWRLMQDLLRFLTLRTDSVMEKLEFKQLAEQ